MVGCVTSPYQYRVIMHVSWHCMIEACPARINPTRRQLSLFRWCARDMCGRTDIPIIPFHLGRPRQWLLMQEHSGPHAGTPSRLTIPNSAQAEIVRLHQKDAYYGELFREQVRDVAVEFLGA